MCGEGMLDRTEARDKKEEAKKYVKANTESYTAHSMEFRV